MCRERQNWNEAGLGTEGNSTIDGHRVPRHVRERRDAIGSQSEDEIDDWFRKEAGYGRGAIPRSLGSG
jgi:hypothetical protein